MKIELANCSVRSWRAADAGPLARFADDMSVWRHMRDSFPSPYTIDDARDWIALAGAQRPELNFAIAHHGLAVGGIGLETKTDIYRKSAEIGYWVGRPFRRRGFATAAVGALTPWAFETLGVQRIFAVIMASNAASIQVMNHAGYLREGRLHRAIWKADQIHDGLLYASWPSLDPPVDRPPGELDNPRGS